MPASASRIGFILSQYRRAVATTASADTRHGTLARETEDPVETYFDDVDDAQVIAAARQTLLSAERRRFSLRVSGLDEALGLTYVSGQMPVASFTDTERDISRSMLVAEIGFDFAKQAAEFTIWG